MTDEDSNMGPCPMGESRAYTLAGESPGECKGDAGEDAPEARPLMRGDGPSLGLPAPFCLVRFICKHRSGKSR